MLPRVSPLFRFPAAARRDPDVEAWFGCGDNEPLRRLVLPWFEALRAADPDARELIHDGRPTACAGDAAFAYVDAFSGHAAIGFFQGAGLPDPAGLLEGAGKQMRHVKLRWGEAVNEAALRTLILAAGRDMRSRLDRGD
ncbi:DUF1801 domain-containing protein [Caulobacter sp. SLTY]|nr:DUF1801 domain-containing protein [Caulobacter sp. SLTY]NBB15303.1 DUF1801 domain-containing protein [Caulobacter sp. SLTY]